MALFANPKLSGYGLPERKPWDTPGIGDGQPGVPATTPAFEPGLGVDAAPVPAKPGMFGKGGIGRAIVGSIGDGLLQASGQAPVYAPAMQQQRARQQQLTDYQQRLKDQQAQWLMQKTYEEAHPAKTELEKLAIAAGYQPGTPEYIALLRQGVQNKADPFQAVPYTDADGSGGLKFIRPSQMGGGQQSPVPGASAPPTQVPTQFMTMSQFSAMRDAPTFKPGHPAWSTPVQISGDEEYDMLPTGKTYVGPDGTVRVK